MARTYKNIPSLHRFIEVAPVESLRGLLIANTDLALAFAAVPWSDATAPDGAAHEFRATLLQTCVDLDARVAGPLEGHARRIVTLAEGKGVEAIQMVSDRLYLHDDGAQTIATEFAAQRDDWGRATVIYLRAPKLFDDAEHYFYAEHHRNYGRLYEAFDLDCDDVADFAWTDAKRLALEALLQERLGADGGCLVQHLSFEQKQAQQGTITVHLFLIRHAGAMNSVQQVRPDLSTAPIYYRPPVEATLLFVPDRKLVEVFTQQEGSRFLIASAFAQAVVDTDLSGRPVAMRQYNLRRFYRSLALPQDAVVDLNLIDARVVEAEARPQNLKRRISLKVDKNDDIESAAEDTLGDNHIFRQASLISRVVLNVRFMKDGKEVNLPITLSTPHRCNLASRRDPQEREIGFAVLERYGIMKAVVPLSAGEESNLFSALLQLYESDAKEVRRSTLEQWGANIELMRAGGFLKPMGRAMDVTRWRDDGTPQHLVVRTKGALLVADDPVTRQAIDIEPIELERFEVMRGWVAERVVKGLRGALRMGQRPKGDAPVVKLGTLVVGEEEEVPVFLARRLSRLDALADADAYLRGERQVGYGLVLTGTEFSPSYLGANVVVWLGDVLVTDAGVVTVDQERLLRALSDGKQRALAAVVIDLIIDSDSVGQERATLIIPGKTPWPLVGQQVVLVERLVAAHTTGNSVLPSQVLFDGMKCNHPQQLFQSETWKTYLGHPPDKKRGWTLLLDE